MKKFLKSIYRAIPFKKTLFLALKKIWHPPERIYRHFHFQDVFTVEVEKDSAFLMRHYGFVIENDIFWAGVTGGWEKKSLSLWIELSKTANVIVDVGANTGIYSLISKCINPNATVLAFEPVSRVYEKLITNIRLNNYDISAFKIALSDKTGEATIYDTEDEHTYSVTVNQNRNIESVKTIPVTIQTFTLDDHIKKFNLPGIDLIKIDVETHEPEVLQGYKEHLYLHKPVLLVEVLNDEVGEKIQEIVAPLNYLYFNISEEKGIRQVSRITQSDDYNYLLCNSDTARRLKLI